MSTSNNTPKDIFIDLVTTSDLGSINPDTAIQQEAFTRIQTRIDADVKAFRPTLRRHRHWA